MPLCHLPLQKYKLVAESIFVSFTIKPELWGILFFLNKKSPSFVFF